MNRFPSALLTTAILLALASSEARSALTFENVIERASSAEPFPETLGARNLTCSGDSPETSTAKKPVDPLTCRGPVYAGTPDDERTLLAATENGRSDDPKQNATVPQFFSQDLIRPGNEALYLEPEERGGGTIAIIDGVQVTGNQLFCEPSGDDLAVDGYLCPPGAKEAVSSLNVPLSKEGAKVSSSADSSLNGHVVRSGRLILDSDFTGGALTRGIASPAGVKVLSYGANPHTPLDARAAVGEAMKQIYEHNQTHPDAPIAALNISMGPSLGDGKMDVYYGICSHWGDKTLDALAATDKPLPKTLGREEFAYVYWKRLERQGKTLIVRAAGNDGGPVAMAQGKCVNFKSDLIVGGSSSYSAGGSRWKSGTSTDASGKVWRNGQGSNFGPDVDIEAGADPMIGDQPRKDHFDDVVGTSFSTPQVTGAALVVSRVNPALDAQGKALVLEATASHLPRLPNSEGGNGKDSDGLPYYAAENGIVNVPLAAAVARALKNDAETKTRWEALRAKCKTNCRGNPEIGEFLKGVAAKVGADFVAKNPKPAGIPKPLPQCRAIVDAYETAMNGFLMSGRRKRLGAELNPYFLQVCEVYKTLKFRNAARTFGCENG